MIPINEIEANLENVREDKVAEIKASIELIGLLHPITVRENDGKYVLVTGRTRLKAFIELGKLEIPAQIETSEITALEIVIHENLRRDNLPWYEQVKLESDLHELRQSQHGKKRTGRNAASSPGWSQVDTARELGVALGSISQDLFLASALKANPHLYKIRDKQTALKLAKDTAKRTMQEVEALTPTSFESDQIFEGDSLEILQEIPENTFDCCLTDPPWLEYKDAGLKRDESTIPTFGEIYRTLKHDSLLYAFVSTPDFFYYQKVLTELHFCVQEFPLIWNKSGVITHGKLSWQYGRTYEPILLAAKGKPALTQGTQLDAVLNYPPIFPTKLLHPHQKPIDLIKTLIGHATFPQAFILDPFAGSGTTLVAAKEMNRRYIGIERDHDYFNKINKRLNS